MYERGGEGAHALLALLQASVADQKHKLGDLWRKGLSFGAKEASKRVGFS